MAGKTVTAADSTHLTGMHSCFYKLFSFSNSINCDVCGIKCGIKCCKLPVI